ncbi:MAG: Antitoxin MqsA [Stenotrophomonas maltophilia]|uniref:Antitoxin MqsA n=1 Tax=Stenotrophomonas maltophilia TaxID=40324 RepID=A0A7V8FGD3_STEMA|nr:MAG: Antitoxin MqsA [Stenotrophomonas maltophilia]
MNNATPGMCPACQKAKLMASTRERHFNPRGNPVVVELQVMECPACGATSTSAAQQIENLRRLAARRKHYGGLLLGEDVLEFRRRHGLTQRAAATLFGKGAIAFSRYENETTYPDDATTMLLSLAMEKPDVVRWLAERTGTVVSLLWTGHRTLPPNPPGVRRGAVAPCPVRQGVQFVQCVDSP